MLEVPWAERWSALVRDVRMLGGARVATHKVMTPSRLQVGPEGSRWLVVREVVRETADALVITFDAGLPEWRAGQFLTLTVPIEGSHLRRAYSLCTLPPAGPAIAVKRVAGGRVSEHLLAHAAPGMRFEVRGPSGQFVLPPRATGPRHVALVGGGSGITPLIALAEEALALGDRVSLVYGNRAPADVIFRARLAALADRGLLVRHVLEAGELEGSRRGRLDAATVAAELEALGGAPDLVYSCGPAPVMASVRDALATLGWPRELLHEERFQSLGERRPGLAERLPTTAQPLRITLRGKTREVLAKPGGTVLEAGLAAGLAMPYSCTMGGCGACRVKLEGDVVHDTPNALTPEEEAAGWAFACVARPLGPCRVEVP